MCNRSVYETPAGVHITLPMPTLDELQAFYASGEQSSSKPWAPPKRRSKLHMDKRPLNQAQLIVSEVRTELVRPGARATAQEQEQPLVIVEMGCGLGYTLYQLARLLAPDLQATRTRLSLVCFESDPMKHPEIRRVFALARNLSTSIEAVLQPRNFGASEQYAADVLISLFQKNNQACKAVFFGSDHKRR